MSRYKKDLIKMNPTSEAKLVFGGLGAAARLEQPTWLSIVWSGPRQQS